MAELLKGNFPENKDDFRVIALDLDGTLLNSDKNISDRNKRALRQAQQEGFSVVIATGRHPNSTLRYIQELDCLNDRAYAVCFNGSAVVSLSEYAKAHSYVNYPVIDSKTAPGSLIKEIASLAHDYGCHVHGYSKQRGLVVETVNKHSLREITHNDVSYEIVDFSKCADDEPFYKLLIAGDSSALDALRPTIPKVLQENFNIVRSDSDFLEFIAQRSTKGTALKALCSMLGCQVSQAIAFGDGENDLDMLRTAGMGVGMANAQQIVLDNVSYVTLSNDDDGVASVVEHFLKG
ncbi:MAG TPA: hypothetical protein DCR21_05215 [Succinivibrionaceae bacterium]|nr:hypothetical protein [Succinivibrionaceae bacterium]